MKQKAFADIVIENNVTTYFIPDFTGDLWRVGDNRGLIWQDYTETGENIYDQ